MEKKISSKNYIIIAVIVILTVSVTFYARNWYITAKGYDNNSSPMLMVVNEIHEDEIYNYILENPKFVLYASSESNSDVKLFEKEFKNYIIDKNLSSNMLYINVDNLNINEFNNKLKDYAIDVNTKNRIDLNKNVSIYIFDNGKITNVIKNAEGLTVEQINSLFKSYGVLDNA